MSATDDTGGPSRSVAEAFQRPAVEVPQPLQAHNCVLCQQRKVKCDRLIPCTSCKRHRVGCVPSAPALPRRRKRKLREDELRAKVTKYEEILKGCGKELVGGGDVSNVDVNGNGLSKLPKIAKRRNLTPSTVDIATPPSKDIERGQMIFENGMSKFLDNNLWTGLSEEFHSHGEILRGTVQDRNADLSTSDGTDHGGGSLLFGITSPITSLTGLHPQPVHIFRLWQTFLDNVNPLSKVIHAPTVQHQILEASADLEKVSRGMEALMFAIYAASANSMDSKECEAMLGESKKILLARFIKAAERALIRASFLTSTDLMVLQALTLFLLAIRQHYDLHAIWILAGVAVRIGQRMGIHREGALLDLSIFEAEIRRRLCWQIVLLDSRSAQLSGAGTSVTANLWDTTLPANINDSDLSPEMKELPLEHNGITEMVFCLIRYEFGNFLGGGSTWSGFDGNWQKLSSDNTPLAEKDRIIDHLENCLDNKFSRYCDPLIPLHNFSASLIKAAVLKLRFVAHHPQQYPDKGASISEQERDTVFATSLKMMEYDTFGQSMQNLKRFLWHVNVHFQFDAFVFMLSELRRRISGPLVDRAWLQVQEVYDNHPELITKTSNEMYAAIGNLTLNAWTSREAGLARQPQRPPGVPTFISSLRISPSSRLQKLTEEEFRSTKLLDVKYPLPGGVDLLAMNGRGSGFRMIQPDPQIDSATPDTGSVDWDFWNSLLENNELQNFDSNGQKLFG